MPTWGRVSDSVGLALGSGTRCTVTVTDEPGSGSRWRVRALRALPRDGSHLVVRTMHRTWQALGCTGPGQARIWRVSTPSPWAWHGSSATAIVTGIVAAGDFRRGDSFGLFDPGFTNDLAARLEGIRTMPRPRSSVGPPCRGPTTRRSGRRRCGWRSTGRRGCRLCSGEQLSTARRGRCCRLMCGWPTRPRTQGVQPCWRRTRTRSGAPGGGHEDWLHQEPRRPSYAASMALVDDLRPGGSGRRHLWCRAECPGPRPPSGR